MVYTSSSLEFILPTCVLTSHSRSDSQLWHRLHSDSWWWILSFPPACPPSLPAYLLLTPTNVTLPLPLRGAKSLAVFAPLPQGDPARIVPIQRLLLAEPPSTVPAGLLEYLGFGQRALFWAVLQPFRTEMGGCGWAALQALQTDCKCLFPCVPLFALTSFSFPSRCRVKTVCFCLLLPGQSRKLSVTPFTHSVY